MGLPAVEPPASTAAAHRRFKPGAWRKIAVIIGGVLIGGAVAFALETAGVPAQIASTVGGALTALVAGAEEVRETRGESTSERVARLVKGEVYRHPLLMAFYTILGVFLVTNLLALPLSIALGAFLVLTNLNQDYAWEVWEPYVYESVQLPFVALVPLYVVLIAKAVAHRIRRLAFAWIGTAVVLSWMIGAALQELWFAVPPPDEGGLSSQFEIALAIGSLVIAVVAAAVGCIWARRTQRAFVMRKLFRQLSPSDQTDVIDLVKTLPR